VLRQGETAAKGHHESRQTKKMLVLAPRRDLPEVSALHDAAHQKSTKEVVVTMEWNRSETIALAKQSCTLCHGMGLRSSWGSRVAPCNCVLRAIFRVCYARFRHCSEKQECLTQKSFEYLPGSGEIAVTYSRKDEEYCADFVSLARRNLSPQEYQIFRFHFLLGADWKLCCGRLQMSRGLFFHAVYRIQKKLGRVYRETRPYPLFPVYEYFDEIKQPVHAFAVEEEEFLEESAATQITSPMRLQPRNTEPDTESRKIEPRRTHQPYPGVDVPVQPRKIA
jgi:hypothetical protein